MITIKTTDSNKIFVALLDVVGFSFDYNKKAFTIKEKWWNKHNLEILEALDGLDYTIL